MIKTLKDYAKHFDTCPRLGKARSHPAICTCGLDTLLSGEGESRREQEELMRAATTRESSASLTNATTTEGRTSRATEDAIRQISKLMAGGDGEVCDTYAQSMTDYCRHCGYAEVCHVEYHIMRVIVEQLVGRVSSSLSEASPDTAQERTKDTP